MNLSLYGLFVLFLKLNVYSFCFGLGGEPGRARSHGISVWGRPKAEIALRDSSMKGKPRERKCLKAERPKTAQESGRTRANRRISCSGTGLLPRPIGRGGRVKKRMRLRKS
jgi:hypothetical protein